MTKRRLRTADPSLPMRLEMFEKPGHLIRRLHQISTAVFIQQAKAYHLTAVQYASLLSVEAYPGIDQAALGRLVALDRTTVSVVVRRLVEKRLLDRKRANGRKLALSLTGTGRAAVDAMRARIGVVDDILLSPLSAGERAIFMQLLAKLVDINNSLSRAPHTAASPAAKA